MEFGNEIVERVWEKARIVPERDPSEWRKDECGAWIRRSSYGGNGSEFAWKIENVSPTGSDDLDNLRPFHRDNSLDRRTGEHYCRVKADCDFPLPAAATIDSPRNQTVV